MPSATRPDKFSSLFDRHKSNGTDLTDTSLGTASHTDCGIKSRHDASCGVRSTAENGHRSDGSECPLYARRGHRHSRRVASIDGEIPADNAIVAAASAGRSSESAASMAVTSTTVAADLHRPIPAAAGRYRRCDGLASAKHHVSAVRRRLHPHSPCTSLGLASHRHILCNSTRRPSTLHEASVIEAVAASHVISVLLSECVERGTIGIARSSPNNCRAKGSN